MTTMHPEQRSSTTARDTGEVPVVRGTTLDAWVSHRWEHGLQIDDLEDLQTLRVETRNSTYDVAVVSGPAGKVLVRGGHYFRDWTPVLLLGSSFGGGLLKRHGVYVGLRLEFFWCGRVVITSPVYAIVVGSTTPPSRPDSPLT